MPDSRPLDLTGEIAEAINNAAVNGTTIVLGYVDAEGAPALSYRGSLLVHGTDRIGFWSRKATGDLIESIAERPVVTLLYFGPKTPGPRSLSIRGRARVAPEENDSVYSAMHEYEQQADAKRTGVAVIVDVDTVLGVDAGGPFRMDRATAG